MFHMKKLQDKVNMLGGMETRGGVCFFNICYQHYEMASPARQFVGHKGDCSIPCRTMSQVVHFYCCHELTACIHNGEVLLG